MPIDSIQRLGVHESVSAVFPPERLDAALADLDAEVELVGDDPDRVADCDGLVTFAYRDYFVDAVEWIHTIQAGYDRFPLETFESEGIVLTNSTGIHDDSVGETVAGYMLSLARRLHTYAANQQAREWDRPDWDEPFTIAGESLCVVGLGTLGRGIAERADALGMEVTGVRRTPEPVPGVEEVYSPDELHDAIEEAKFVVLAVPLTDDTRNLVGRDELDAMADDAYLLNVARGGVVDQPALVDAIERDAIAGAALDVFENEPLSEDSPLWDADDVIVTPHAAAATRDYFRSIDELVRENVARIGADEELHNRVI
ncbi:D-2-hydroxyacid dehydrogenase (NADP+) [Natronoarchaeum philippinense]|uniref:D-2-hydroxyacid dehydrogenase (NADP+) n=1 Tax=Natronoarchaeum philippinense TaxID=558529 RepID=A0A285NSI1_NATPI|nr:D-2-hydroxyacid dehydrogenase [Natronoarchaeum philippinense]SNZ12419.1 D-2-hydroxyacid dehydrogenase (NADP+) [Natronoarchaeum philippinense]